MNPQIINKLHLKFISPVKKIIIKTGLSIISNTIIETSLVTSFFYGQYIWSQFCDSLNIPSLFNQTLHWRDQEAEQ